MSEQVSVLVLEQRAWRGIRLCAKSHVKKTGVDDRDFYVEIGYHYPKRQFYVEVSYTYYDWRKGTYGSPEYYAQSVEDCIAWIEKQFNVKVTIEGEKIAQEQSWLQEQEAKKK